MTIKIAVIDDHKLVLQGICLQLQKNDNFIVAGSFIDANELLLFLKNNKVDILISDLMLKGCHGFNLVKKIQAEIDPDLKIILISGYYEEILHKQSLELGVRAFLRKEASSEELAEAIIQVYEGNIIIPESIINFRDHKLLSEMETNILKLLVLEYTNDEIASRLFISRRTVETHITSICQKLNVRGRSGAVREAIRLGIN